MPRLRFPTNFVILPNAASNRRARRSKASFRSPRRRSERSTAPPRPRRSNAKSVGRAGSRLHRAERQRRARSRPQAGSGQGPAGSVRAAERISQDAARQPPGSSQGNRRVDPEERDARREVIGRAAVENPFNPPPTKGNPIMATAPKKTAPVRRAGRIAAASVAEVAARAGAVALAAKASTRRPPR